jgi:hypothetical protein
VNKIQRITTFVGFCVVGLMLLVPPWKYIQTMRSGDMIPPLERNAGYALVFSPPSLKDQKPSEKPSPSRRRVKLYTPPTRTICGHQSRTPALHLAPRPT